MKSWFIAVLLLISSYCFGQNAGKIAGTVTDKAGKKAVPGASVVVKGTRLGAATDIGGNFVILNVPPGTYEVTASIVGYQTVTQQQVVVDINRTTTLDYTLTETTVDLPEVSIIARRPDVELDKTTTSTLIRPEEIETIASMQTVDDVLTLASDVTDGHFRGGREGEESYNLSGMSVMNPLDNTSAFVPMISAVGEVEVLTSGFSAQYGNAQSGIINISMKEGQSDKWRTRAEIRSRVPAYKHFGPSVFEKGTAPSYRLGPTGDTVGFNPGTNPYLWLLDSYGKWMGVDQSNGQRYYSSIGNGFDNRYAKDTVTLAQIASMLWNQEGRRDLNRRYDNLSDYNIDITAGGPLSARSRLFIGARVDNVWPTIPTAEPDIKRQITGNVAFDIQGGATLRVLGSYSQENGHVFRSSHTTGLISWLWDRVLGINYSTRNNTQLGLRFTNPISTTTYYDIKLSALSTNYKDGSPVTSPDGYSGGDPSKIIWGSYSSTPDGLRIGDIDDNFRDERTRTVSLDGSLISQVTRAHQILAGVQANAYQLDVNNVISIMSTGSQYLEKYHATPFEIGFYAQDKMEFEGFIASIGLRWDVWNQKTNYYSDLYSPFRIWLDSGSYRYDVTKPPDATTPTLGRLQPRIGFSFPVSPTTVFHLNYGSFVQRPSFDRTVLTHIPTDGYARVQLGNPRLLPEVTNQYDMGIMQGFGEGLTLDISGYYKDVRNLIQRANYVDREQTLYSTYVNRDYADIRGFRAALNKRQGMLTGSISYTFGVATGKSSSPMNNPLTYNETTGPMSRRAEDILLDFDRTHNLIINVAFNTPERWGPQLFGTWPLDRFTISVYSFARSGRPYTFDREGETALMNHRSPPEYNTKLRLTKRLPRMGDTNPMIYLEVNNLFNERIYSYNAVFQDATAANGSSYQNPNLDNYENHPERLQYFIDDRSDPFSIDGNHLVANQEFLLYDNMPRSISLGLVMNF